MKKTIFVALALTIISGCTHAHKVNGPVDRSEIPEGVQVSIGDKEITEGSKLDVKVKKCRDGNEVRGKITRLCSFEKTGEAVVLKVLDHDSAIVRPLEGVILNSETFVEKSK